MEAAFCTPSQELPNEPWPAGGTRGGGLKWGRGGLREEQPLAALGIMQTGVTTSSCKGVVPDMEIPDMGGLQKSSLHFPAPITTYLSPPGRPPLRYLQYLLQHFDPFS